MGKIVKITPALKAKTKRILDALDERFGTTEWRSPWPPIHELVCTILSQNTNDRNRDIAFNRLLEKYPTWDEVRDADSDELIDCIRIAGLANQKGPRIQQVLRDIEAERGSLDLTFLKEMSVEDALRWLTKFKGVGLKTASIVLVFALDMPAFPVDTHIYRVSGRLGIRPEKMTADQAHAWLAQLIEPERYGPGHLNLIRLGREICHARKPDCPVCPVSAECAWYKANYK